MKVDRWIRFELTPRRLWVCAEPLKMASHRSADVVCSGRSIPACACDPGGELFCLRIDGQSLEIFSRHRHLRIVAQRDEMSGKTAKPQLNRINKPVGAHYGILFGYSADVIKQVVPSRSGSESGVMVVKIEHLTLTW